MTSLGRVRHMISRIIAALVICVGLGGIALMASLWVEHNLSVSLPKPIGRFVVGRAIYDWTDDHTFDPLAPVPRTKRELLVWLWYPAASGPGATSEYYPAVLRTAIMRQTGVLLSQFLTRDLSKVRAHSFEGLAVSSLQRSYPVILLRAGASLEVASYSTLAEDLASHGYFVVGVDAPYRTGVVAFPDGRVIYRTAENNPELCSQRVGQERDRCASRFLTAWDSDLSYVLDRLAALNTSDPSGKFKGELDMTRVGIFGHSFGGAQAAEFCGVDSRCKAGVDLDGAPQGSVIQTGIQRPFMILLSDHTREFDAETRQIKSDIQSLYERIPDNDRMLIIIRGANHFTFSDDGAILKSHLARGVLRVVGKLAIDGDRQLVITSHCLHTFFDAYLQDSPSSPQIESSLYPELQIAQSAFEVAQ